MVRRRRQRMQKGVFPKKYSYKKRKKQKGGFFGKAWGNALDKMYPRKK